MTKMSRKIGFFLLFAVMGCANSSPNINFSYTNRIDLPELPRPMVLMPVEWKVQNLDILLNDLQSLNMITENEKNNIMLRFKNGNQNRNWVQFVLDAKNFENNSLNQAEILRFLEQQRVVIQYFIEATEPTRTITSK